MNFSKAFTYIFDDPDWVSKLLGPILFSLIPIVGTLTFSGYILDLIRNVSQRVEHPLPTMDIGAQMGRGFRWFLAQLVYSLPMVVLGVLMAIFVGFTVNASDSSRVQALPVMMIVVLGFLMFLYGIVLWIVLPVAQANFANKDSFSSGLNFGEIFRMVGNNFGAWLLVYLGLIIAGVIAPLGSFIIIIGVVITTAYSQLMTGHLQGQAYLLSQSKGSEALQAY